MISRLGHNVFKTIEKWVMGPSKVVTREFIPETDPQLASLALAERHFRFSGLADIKNFLRGPSANTYTKRVPD